MIRVALALVLAAAAIEAVAGEACAPAALHLVRHAEKADAPGDRDPLLSEAGNARARALAAWFEGRPLHAIYTTHLRRTQHTALPTARAHGLELRVLPADADQALLLRLRERHCGEHVLVVGHSNTVPPIAAAFGAPPFEIDEAEFGTVYSLQPPATTLAQDRFGDPGH